MRSSTYKRKPYNHCCSFNTRVVLLSVQCAWTGCCTENMFPIYPPVNGAARRTRELRSTIFAEWRSGMLAFALAACGFADALRAGLSHQACGKTCRRHASAIACDSWLCELRALRDLSLGVEVHQGVGVRVWAVRHHMQCVLRAAEQRHAEEIDVAAADED